jgi:8-oxo-dGTP pyrophosphatase MutT (NUDIX family)
VAEVAAVAEVVAEPEIAAAVCYRRRDGRSQFLLVRTSDGARWTFLKGGVEKRETLAEAAAREADEEAGASGVVAGTLLTEYRHAPSRRAGHADDLVAAFLLKVRRAGTSCEPGRNPTWFDVATARERLAEGRDAFHAQELQRVLDATAREMRRR